MGQTSVFESSGQGSGETLGESIVLVAIDRDEPGDWGVEESLEELERLVDTAGGVVIDQIVQKRDKPHPRFYVGPGKIEEIREQVEALEATLVVFDDELSPAQVRSIESALDLRVIDRSQVILDIFAQRAQTKEGRLQVELAQLHYLLPRLTGKGVELSRLGGGIGTRGPGETRLEVDRRRIRQRIADLREQVEAVKKHRDHQRARRKKSLPPVVALVGYTNAGKSTLLTALTGAEVLAEDKLFATLDPTIRAVSDASGPGFLVVDTVGFINKLPHELVAAFQATLEEVVEADVIVHVADVSNPHFEVERRIVHQVLEELGAIGNPIVTAFNKIDLVQSQEALKALKARTPNSVLISAAQGQGLDELIEAIEEQIPDPLVTYELAVPYKDGQIVGWLHDNGKVLEQRYEGDMVHLSVEMPQSLIERVSAYRLP